MPENSDKIFIPLGYSGFRTEKWKATVKTEKLFPNALYLARVL
jgi:hypothetical protein